MTRPCSCFNSEDMDPKACVNLMVVNVHDPGTETTARRDVMDLRKSILCSVGLVMCSEFAS
jgi:hypothetical protein